MSKIKDVYQKLNHILLKKIFNINFIDSYFCAANILSIKANRFGLNDVIKGFDIEYIYWHISFKTMSLRRA